MEHYSHLKNLLTFTSNQSSPLLRVTLILTSTGIGYLAWYFGLYIDYIISAWFFLFVCFLCDSLCSTLYLGCLSFCAVIDHSFSFWVLFYCVSMSGFIRSCIERHVSSLHCMAVRNSSARTMLVCLMVHICLGGYLLGKLRAWLLRTSTDMFYFLMH